MGNYYLFKQKLADLGWDIISNDNEAAIKFSDIISEHAGSTIPNKTVTIRQTDKPWMRNDIRRLIRKRKRLHKIAKKSNSPQHWTDIRQIRNICVTEIRNAKSDFIKHLSNELISNKVPAKEW